MTPRRNDDDSLRAVIAGLDIMAEYRALGLRLAGDTPRTSGAIEAYAYGRDERKPSAWVDTTTGRYGDSNPGSTGIESASLFDFAIKVGQFTDFKSALHYYADKAGVKLTGGKKKSEGKLEFQDWDSGNDRLVAIWCAIHKPGTSLDAIKRAGSLVARYYILNKAGQRFDKNTVIALPCYRPPGLVSVDPVAWVLFDIGGGQFENYHGKGQPPTYSKMISLGKTSGTLMNREAVAHLASGLPTELVWKTAGPSDMLALMTAIPSDLRDTHVALSNASGETGGVPDELAKVFAGRRLMICHDRDEAGEAGNRKWLAATAKWTAETRVVTLPYQLRKKAGLDLRDYLNGREDVGVQA